MNRREFLLGSLGVLSASTITASLPESQVYGVRFLSSMGHHKIVTFHDNMFDYLNSSFRVVLPGGIDYEISSKKGAEKHPKSIFDKVIEEQEKLGWNDWEYIV